MTKTSTCKQCGFTGTRGEVASHYWAKHYKPKQQKAEPKSNGSVATGGIYETVEHELKHRAHAAIDSLDTAALNKAIVQLQTLRDHGSSISQLLTEPVSEEVADVIAEREYANV